MRQIVQNQKTGEIIVDDVPCPTLVEGRIIVRNAFSVISVGTERAAITEASQSLVSRAKNNPDKVRQVLASAKRDGLIEAYKKVKNRLDRNRAIGYSSAGVVVESSVVDFKSGDRVACAGYGYHAEYVSVPPNLCTHVPDGVGLDEAAFCTLGAISLQGVRQAQLNIGENVVVVGLGLIGLITVAILKANGCRVLGVDISAQTFLKAKELGCDDMTVVNQDSLKRVESFTNGIGADAVIITASSSSNQPMEYALAYCRKRGKIVVVGDVGMTVKPGPFYEKELELKISTSYGPGRYDARYEEGGLDYPVAYVRWTENRNMEAIIDLLDRGRLSFKPLISHVFQIEEGPQAYELITGKKVVSPLGVLLKYPEDSLLHAGDNKKIGVAKFSTQIPKVHGDKLSIGFIGLGSFASTYLIPAFQKVDSDLVGVCTLNPVTAKDAARRFHFQYASTDPEELINDHNIDTVVIATRHETHSRFVLKALAAGKNVFVEKPLAVNADDLKSIKNAVNGFSESRPRLMVGFNRRFSPAIAALKGKLDGRKEPLAILYRVNAGFVGKNHWTQAETQGGRIIGEACHFTDTMRFLTGSKITFVQAKSIRGHNLQIENRDTSAITISFEDGSLGSLLYLGNGASSLPKEYCEVYWEGKTAVMDDFRKLELYSARGKVQKKFNGSKGHFEEVQQFVRSVLEGTVEPIPFEEIDEVSRYTIEINDLLTKNVPAAK